MIDIHSLFVGIYLCENPRNHLLLMSKLVYKKREVLTKKPPLLTVQHNPCQDWSKFIIF